MRTLRRTRRTLDRHPERLNRHPERSEGSCPLAQAGQIPRPARNDGRSARNDGRSARNDGRSAFTLTELILTVGIAGVLMTGLASAVLIASHAAPDPDGPAVATAQAAAVLDQIVDELSEAIWIRKHTDRKPIFMVPDRDGDGLPERIAYSWSSTPGDPLLRNYNATGLVPILDDVHEFALTYATISTDEQYPAPQIESAETLFSNAGLLYHDHEFKIKATDWIGQHFVPSLPPETLSWKVTRVMFQAKQSKLPGTSKVQIRTVDASNLPTTTVLDEQVMDAAALAADWEWEQFSFANVPDQSPGDGLCFVIVHAGGDEPAIIHKDDHAGTGKVKTTKSGAPWEYVVDRQLFHYVYGTYMTQGPDQTATRSYFTGVQIALRVGDDAAARGVTATPTPNTPELLEMVWETEFDDDPTLDHNGDKTADWIAGSGSFDLGTLGAGVWTPDTTLSTNPDNDFITLTTAEVRFGTGGLPSESATFRINADWSGGLHAPLEAVLEGKTGAQMLTIRNETAPGTYATLLQLSDRAVALVNVRLVIDPTLDTVAVWVDDQHQGTYAYSSYVPGADAKFASVTGSGAGVEFDHVSIRVSE